MPEISNSRTFSSLKLPVLSLVLCFLHACSEGVDSGNTARVEMRLPDPAELEAQSASQLAMLDEYCMDCHNSTDWAGELALDLIPHDDIAAEAEVWETVLRKLRGRMMPPPGKERPEGERIDSFVAWLEASIDQSSMAVHPGDKLMHRLNRTEYANAIEDLLALEVDPAALLPVDGAEDGFDNIATALQVTPSFIDQYLNAARVVSNQAVGTPSARPSGTAYQFSGAGQEFHVDGLPLGTRGGGRIEHYFPSDGRYTLSIADMSSGLAYSNLEHVNTLIATLDGRKIFEMNIGGPEQTARLDRLRAPALEEINARMQNIEFNTTAGPHEVAVFFLHRSFAESDAPLRQLTPDSAQDRIASLRQIEIFGPIEATGLSRTPSRERIFICQPMQDTEAAACAHQIVVNLADRAFRGFLADEDTALLMRMYAAGEAEGGFEQGIRFALSGILAHPKFLYRMELVPELSQPGGVYELGSLELASRLAFFLWSSLPDDELLQVAASDGLKDPLVLEQQVRRMLQDDRARNLADNFAYQWLGLAGLADVTPDGQLFRDVSRGIREDMTTEALLFTDSIFREDRSVLDLLSADHTYLNETLALHYGIRNVRGSEFRRVVLEDQKRRGILGKGAVLMVSSYPNRTSPVLRGKWLLENIIGTPPAAPPPDVEGFVEIEPGQEFTTVRERLETHRSNPACNGCHGVIDPLGFALENFDATGRWQDIDRFARTPIDASGELADGTPVDGPEALREALLERPDQFVQTFTEKLMTFALGRGLEYSDMPAVRRIVRQAAGDDYRFSSLVLEIVSSEQFRMGQTGDGNSATAASTDNQPVPLIALEN